MIREERFIVPWEVGGVKEMIEIVIPGEHLNRDSHTALRTIEIEGITDDRSTSAHFPNDVPLFKLMFSLNREVNPNTTGGLSTTGSLQLTDVLFVIPTDIYEADIAGFLQQAKSPAKISVKDPIIAGEIEPKIRREIVFGGVDFVTYYPGYQASLFIARAQELLVKVSKFNQDDKEEAGNIEFKINLRTCNDATDIASS